jgi:O-antigen ligase
MLWLLIGYMFLFIHRPFEIWPVLADIRLERIYILAVVLLVAVSPGKRWLANRQHGAYLAFAAAVLFCWVASPWADAGEVTVENYFKLLVFYVLIMLMVHDERTLKRLLLAFLVVMAVYMLHSLREYRNGRHTYRMGIPRMIGVDKSLGDPNSFGASLVYALPFVTPFWMSNPSRRLRWFLAGYVALSFVCIGLTGSRSSLLGLLLWALLTIFWTRWRWRILLLACMIAPLLWAALPPALQNRFETIIHPEVGPANAIVSGQDRLEGLRIGLNLWASNPVTGCGPGAWKAASRRDLESHNLYGQLLGEMGTVGAVAFGLILLGFWANLRAIRRTYRQHPEWDRDFLFHLTRAIGLAVLLMLFEGNFGHNLFRFNWLWYGGFLIIARWCVQQRVQEEELVLSWQEELAPAFAHG